MTAVQQKLKRRGAFQQIYVAPPRSLYWSGAVQGLRRWIRPRGPRFDIFKDSPPDDGPHVGFRNPATPVWKKNRPGRRPR